MWCKIVLLMDNFTDPESSSVSVDGYYCPVDPMERLGCDSCQ